MRKQKKAHCVCVGLTVAVLAAAGACNTPEADRELDALRDEVKNLREMVEKSSPKISSTDQLEYEIKLVHIPLGATGAEACESLGMDCISLKSTKTNDEQGRFCGYAALSCTSRLRERRHCMESPDGGFYDYAIDRVRWRKAANADRGAKCGNTGDLCLYGPEYDSAICIGGVNRE